MEAIPILTSGLFAGSALAVSINEYPYWKGVDPKAALKQFCVTFKGIAAAQGLSALTASGSALIVATQIDNKEAKNIYIVGGLAMFSILPYTLFGIMPTNKQLFSAEKKEDAQIVQLLDKWAKLHAVRTVVSIAAFAGFTYAAVCAKK